MTSMRAADPSSTPDPTPAVGGPVPLPGWGGVPDRLRARGLRWTPQRRILVEVLSKTDGHVTGAELVERCRAIDLGTIPSTVYRTLDVLEELGIIRHSHGADGREEFHVQPDRRARPPLLPPLRRSLGARSRRPGRRGDAGDLRGDARLRARRLAPDADRSLRGLPRRLTAAHGHPADRPARRSRSCASRRSRSGASIERWATSSTT